MIGDGDDVAVLDLPVVEVWAPGEEETDVGIPLREVSGRRIRLPPTTGGRPVPFRTRPPAPARPARWACPMRLLPGPVSRTTKAPRRWVRRASVFPAGGLGP